MNWLNSNAPAIQALGSLANLAMATILAAITWRYVKLTEGTARAALMQRDEQVVAARVELQELRSLIIVFKMNLTVLPKDRSGRDRFRSLAPSWHQVGEQLPRFQALAVKLEDAGDIETALAVTSLMWIRDRVSESIRLDPSDEEAWNSFPWEVWLSELEDAKSSIRKLNVLVMARLGIGPSEIAPSDGVVNALAYNAQPRV